MTISAAEARRQAQIKQAAAMDKIAREREAAERALEARKQEIYERDLPSYIRIVDAKLERSIEEGNLSLYVDLPQMSDKDSNYDCYRPVWDALKKHYEAAGYTAFVHTGTGMEWYGDGAGSNGIIEPYIRLNWGDDNA